VPKLKLAVLAALQRAGALRPGRPFVQWLAEELPRNESRGGGAWIKKLGGIHVCSDSQAHAG
jgi:hypothetical protein